MKLLFYSIKDKKIKEYKWNEVYILNNLLEGQIRIPRINENKYITKEYLILLKNKISELEDYIPLYNINIRDIQIINKSKIYDKIIKESYRFPDKFIITNIQNELIKYKNKKLSENQQQFYEKLKRTYFFLINFNYKILKISYVNNMYYGSTKIGKDITTYERISYLPFLYKSRSYYSRSEIINMGLNFGDIKPDETYYDKDKLHKLYYKIIKQDFSSRILLENLYYINSQQSYNIVQFYTFHGSYYMNYYLRDIKNKIIDEFLETLIKHLWKLILKAPIIKKEKFVYRFLSDDSFLQHLELNDIYQDYGFLSATRNQFYDIDSDKFGYILLKIILPQNSGGCLCVEPYSLFIDEEEVILPPFSKLKLINKDYDVNFYHINDSSEKKITKKYEFIYLGSSFNNSILKKKKENIRTYDFLKYIIEGKTLAEKIDYFYNSVIKTNKYKKFYLLIDNKKILFYCDFYDSSDMYGKFFNLKRTKGFYFYSLNSNGQYNYYIEFGKQLYINYYMKYSSIDLKINNFYDVISYISYAFNIKNAIIYNIYDKNNKFVKKKIYHDDENLKINSAYITNYNVDLYNYLKLKKKRFNSIYIIENFNYFYLDILSSIKIDEILTSEDTDKLYYIYKNYYKDNNNIKNFYIYITENYWYLINELNKKLENLFNNFNQNFEFTYIFNTYAYLYSKNKIKIILPVKVSSDLDEYKIFTEIYKKNYKKKLRGIEF